jgi:hypothetical protein
MSRPVKRSCLSPDPNDLRYDTSSETQRNINASHSKRQRQHSTTAPLRSLSGQQDMFLWKTSSFSDQQSSFIESSCRIAGNYKIDWDLELHVDVPNLPGPYLGPGHFVVPDTQLAAILDPNFGHAESRTGQSRSEMRIESSSLSGFLTFDQGISNYLPSQELENIKLYHSIPSLWSHGSDGAVNSLISDGEQRYTT